MRARASQGSLSMLARRWQAFLIRTLAFLVFEVALAYRDVDAPGERALLTAAPSSASVAHGSDLYGGVHTKTLSRSDAWRIARAAPPHEHPTPQLALGFRTSSLLERSDVAHVASTLASSAVAMIPGVPAAQMAKFAAACFCCVVLYKAIMSIDCNSKKFDCRRFRCIKKPLLANGYDEFADFAVRVTVHCVQDIVNKGMFGGTKEFQISIMFRWSRWATTGTKDMRWEQTKGMDVPQGATECYIKLESLGTVYNTTLAEICLEVKADMLDKPDFWDAKQKMKLTNAGKHVGVLLITFRKKGEGDEDDVPIKGVDEDSALAMELVEAYEQLCEEPGYIKKPGKLEGEEAVALLARTLEGNLREIDKDGKELGKLYAKVICCNFAELQGDDMKHQMEKQLEKAKKKGLSEVEHKWYWVWYESKAKADDEKKWHYPDGFFPILSITSVHRSPERDDQFVLKYSGGKTDVLIYRREQGKGLETWVDGLDLISARCRNIVKDKQKAEQMKEKALPKMRQMHAAFVQQNGFPKTQDQWKAWFDYFTSNNYGEDLVKALYEEITAEGPSEEAAPQPSGRSAPPPQAGKGGKKGKASKGASGDASDAD